MSTYHYRPVALQPCTYSTYEEYVKHNPVSTDWKEEADKYENFVSKFKDKITAKLPTKTYILSMASALPLYASNLLASPTLQQAVTDVENAMTGAEQIRVGFKEIFEVGTAIAEPILWFYAITGCVLMATDKNRDKGWSRLKNVGYSYIVMSILPTLFSFLRWVATILSKCFILG